MAYEDSPYRVGEFWLDKRDDGASPDIWQIAWYDADKRRNRYRSTRSRDLAAAKTVIEAHLARIRAVAPAANGITDPPVVPQIILYYDEHGKDTDGEKDGGSVSSILRAFIAFLKQDAVGLTCTMSQLKGAVWKRFIAWRSKPHTYTISWKGKEYTNSSKGVSDATIKKNIQIIVAALNHAVAEDRAIVAPKPAKKLTSALETPGRDRVLSCEEMGAIIGYARSDRALYRFVCLLMATGMRPEAARQFRPDQQYRADFGLLDLHPSEAKRTKKRNPIVPCIPQFAQMIEGHVGYWVAELDGTPFKRMTTRWNTMRDILDLDAEVIAKTIRHTVASNLLWRGVDQSQIGGLLGHVAEGTTTTYAHYNPNRLADARSGLIALWDEWTAAADAWNGSWAVAYSSKNKLVLVDRATINVPYDPYSRLVVAQCVDPEEARIARNKQINAARKARKAAGDSLAA